MTSTSRSISTLAAECFTVDHGRSANSMPPPVHALASCLTVRPTLGRDARAACLLVGLWLPLGACQSYAERTEAAYRDFQAGRFDAAMTAYTKESLTGSAFLAGAEAGMVALAAGNWERAQKELGGAAAAVAEHEQSALVSPESAARSLSSFALNERALEYRGEGYERVQVHVGLALAYLARGAIESAQVEVRRANALLESEEKLYKKQYRAGGLGHLLSAVAYELAEEPDQAYIDYKRLHEKGLGGELVTRSLARLARELGRAEEQAHWESLYGVPDPLPDGAARVILIGAVGEGAFKVEGTLTIPTRSGFLQWSVPSYRRRPQPVQQLVLEAVEEKLVVESVVIEPVTEVAEKILDDRLMWLATKSTVRTLLKREMTRELEDKHGLAGRIAGDLFTFFSERADLRAWHTLPDTWQAARLYLRPGEHKLRLSAAGGASVLLGQFELDPGETMFVFARTLQDRLYAYPVGGLRLAHTSHYNPAKVSPLPDSAASSSVGRLDGRFKATPVALGRFPCIRHYTRRSCSGRVERCELEEGADASGTSNPISDSLRSTP